MLDALLVTGVINEPEFDRQEEELAAIGSMVTRRDPALRAAARHSGGWQCEGAGGTE